MAMWDVASSDEVDADIVDIVDRCDAVVARHDRTERGCIGSSIRVT